MQIPTEEAFITGWRVKPDDPEAAPKPVFRDFLDAPELREIGDRLIKSGPLTSYDDGKLRIDYRWKHKGGMSGGNAIGGKCVKLSGPAKHYADGAHFLVWLAADHCEVEGFSDRQIEALVYHELLHIERVETDEEDLEGQPIIKYRTRGHDFEGFYSELEQYGMWNRVYQRLDEVVRQMALPGFEPQRVAATV